MSEIRVSKIRGSEIRGSEIRGSEIRISSNHRELHGAIFDTLTLKANVLFPRLSARLVVSRPSDQHCLNLTVLSSSLAFIIRIHVFFVLRRIHTFELSAPLQMSLSPFVPPVFSSTHPFFLSFTDHRRRHRADRRKSSEASVPGPVLVPSRH